ncbi:transketolase, pyrimidine binding domain protein, partial [Chlamydia psittaci C1/97]
FTTVLLVSGKSL